MVHAARRVLADDADQVDHGIAAGHALVQRLPRHHVALDALDGAQAAQVALRAAADQAAHRTALGPQRLDDRPTHEPRAARDEHPSHRRRLHGLRISICSPPDDRIRVRSERGRGAPSCRPPDPFAGAGADVFPRVCAGLERDRRGRARSGGLRRDPRCRRDGRTGRRDHLSAHVGLAARGPGARRDDRGHDLRRRLADQAARHDAGRDVARRARPGEARRAARALPEGVSRARPRDDDDPPAAHAQRGAAGHPAQR